MTQNQVSRKCQRGNAPVATKQGIGVGSAAFSAEHDPQVVAQDHQAAVAQRVALCGYLHGTDQGAALQDGDRLIACPPPKAFNLPAAVLHRGTRHFLEAGVDDPMQNSILAID